MNDDSIVALLLFFFLATVLFCLLTISNHKTDIFIRQCKKYMR